MLLNGGELDGVRVLARSSVDLMVNEHLPPGACARRPVAVMTKRTLYRSILRNLVYHSLVQ